ncbi:sulfotransferase [Cyclobacterium roseum]|uniref:sulfotransferase n=1 Tax=Cyclobacterium roseum TaxID=2666137 RepID=UPI0013915300|nr:sulfotransferase [Cyclobacterium roseum]
MNKHKHILVTGSHRSGSTWLGKVISRAEGIHYIHEPFNIDIKRINSPLRFWYEDVGSKTISEQTEIENYINSFLSLWHKQNGLRFFSFFQSIKYANRFFWDFKGIFKPRLLIKDPLAVFSAGWFYQYFKWQTIVIIRHPAAFVASLKVAKWDFDFNNFLKQDRLIKGKLSKYSNLIEEYALGNPDIIDQGILLWNIIHDEIRNYQNEFAAIWYFVKHEDLSHDPSLEFQKIFGYLDLNFSKNVQLFIEKTSKSSSASNLKRDSQKNIKSWKKRLNTDEISRIKVGTQKLWVNFYNESDW